MYDVIIIGMGPAGMSAAVYAKRSGLNVLMLEKGTPGGLLNSTNKVDNYLGFETIGGPDLAYSMFCHTQKEEIPYRSEEVERVIIEKDKKIVITTEEAYETKAIIICGGRQARRTALANEADLVGKGLSYCAVCDAPMYKGKVVGIIGGGNSAFEEGVYLADFASKVYIFNRSEAPKADSELQQYAKEKGNIEVMVNTSVKEVNLTDDRISSVEFTDGRKLDISGLFIYIGFEPSTRYLEDLNILTPDGYVDVDKDMRTNIKGIYAAGDTVKKSLYQIVTAASEGAIAAISCKKDINSL